MSVSRNVRQDNVRLFTWFFSGFFFFFCGVLVGMADCVPLSDGGCPSTRCFREKTWLWNSCRQQLLGYIIVWSSLWLHIHTQSAKFFLRAVSLVVIYSYHTPPPTWPLLYQPWERQVQDTMWRIRPITWRMGEEEEEKSNLNTFLSRGDQSPNLFGLS